LLNECAEVRAVPKAEWSTSWRQWVKERAKQRQLPALPAEPKGKTPDADRQNAEAFEAQCHEMDKLADGKTSQH
jgi:hypothetical protein